MKTFKDILEQKYEQLEEAGTPVPGSTGVMPGGTPQAADPNAQQQQQQQAQDPNSVIAHALGMIDWSNPEIATQTLNTAVKTVGNPQVTEYFGQAGFDPTQGFVYQKVPQQQGATPATTAAQQAGVTPNSYSTTTASQSQAAKAPSIGA